jgi:hypothetical protein
MAITDASCRPRTYVKSSGNRNRNVFSADPVLGGSGIAEHCVIPSDLNRS